jgi:hypothetical protein
MLGMAANNLPVKFTAKPLAAVFLKWHDFAQSQGQ